MNIELRKISGSIKVAFFCTVLFSFICLQVCASDKKMTPEQAKEARLKIVESAKSLLGSPYSYGGIGPSEFDCSGFVYYVFRSTVKIQLPRTAKAIYDFCTPIEDKDLEEGDLVFFKTTDGKKISHVGIYIGGGDFISAISDGKNTGVQVRTLLTGYWKDAYAGAGQIICSGKTEKKQESKQEQKENKQEETKAPVSEKQKNVQITQSFLIEGCTMNECCY